MNSKIALWWSSLTEVQRRFIRKCYDEANKSTKRLGQSYIAVDAYRFKDRWPQRTDWPKEGK